MAISSRLLKARKSPLLQPPFGAKPPAYRVFVVVISALWGLTAAITAFLRPDLWIPGPDQLLVLIFLLVIMAVGEVFYIMIPVSSYGVYVTSSTYNLVAPLMALFTPAALAGVGSTLITATSSYSRSRRVHLAAANAAIDIQQLVLARLTMEALSGLPPGPRPAAFLQAAAAYVVLRGISTANVAVLRATAGYESLPEALRRLASGKWLPMDAAVSTVIVGLLIDAAQHSLWNLVITVPAAATYASVYLIAGASFRRITAGLLCPLTGLATHTVLWEALHNRLSSGQRASLMMIDIDHFKQINDTRGHLEGDRILRSVAEAIIGTVSVSDMVARYGGEEFAVLLSVPSDDMLSAVAERIRRTVEERCGVTVSIGAASAEPGVNPEAVVEAADAALYRAKRAGRNRVEIAPPPGGKRIAAARSMRVTEEVRPL